MNLRRSTRGFFDDLFSNPAYQPLDLNAEQIFIADETRINRDPFDALICAAARTLDLPLLTRDVHIRKSGGGQDRAVTGLVRLKPDTTRNRIANSVRLEPDATKEAGHYSRIVSIGSTASALRAGPQHAPAPTSSINPKNAAVSDGPAGRRSNGTCATS